MDAGPLPPDAAPSGYIPESQQRPGDPEAGYRALVNEGYVRCGIPYSTYTRVFAPAESGELLPGREGHNATLPYNFTAFTTETGVEAVAPNCLQCHAGRINGELIVGLGNTTADYTTDNTIALQLGGGLITDPAEREHYDKWLERMLAISPYIVTATVGVNPADNLAAVLFAHRDPDTLAWSPEPLMDLPPSIVLPIDVPPWWRMSKKHSMFYNGAGRGDHARIMMTASALCTDTVSEAAAIDSYFPDVRAYIASLEPPAWPWDIDSELAQTGRALFDDNCARCHGTYGPDGHYPNRLIDIDEVATDDALILGTSQFAGRFVDWFNDSFYGEIARLEPEQGYVAPPLDGVWATAPYLHNGSVPTIAALLDTASRPTYWRRTFDSTDYDPDALGWRYQTLDSGHADEPNASVRRMIYDTTLLGYSNVGHDFGDPLTPAERAAILEYLKTL